MRIRQGLESDWPSIRRIYEQGIAMGHATFQDKAPDDWQGWLDRFRPLIAVVAEEEGLLGWGVVSKPASSRAVYSGVCESTLYVSSGAQGRGVGRSILAELIEQSEAQGVWTLTAGIFPENLASIRLHESLGFGLVGTRRRIGKMTHGPLAGEWRDVLWYERRSRKAGLS